MGIVSILACSSNDGGKCDCGEHGPMVKHLLKPGAEELGLGLSMAHPDTPEERAKCSWCMWPK